MAQTFWADVVHEDYTEIAIIGGGVCGTILAGRCMEQNIECTIIDRQETLGGVWLEYANKHSSLQASSDTTLRQRYCAMFCGQYVKRCKVLRLV